MNGMYLQAVLKGWRNSLLFVCALLLDGVMWFLLRSEIARCCWGPACCAGAER
jgi:inner membrane protein involved in colicin E2 resistance